MKSSIHNKLAITLVIAALFLSVLFGGAQLLLDFFSIERQVIAFATSEGKTFSAKHAGKLHHQTLQEALQSFLDERTHAPNGHLIAIRIVSADGSILAEANDGTNVSKFSAHLYISAIPDGGLPDHSVIWDKDIFVRVTTPLLLQEDDETVFFNGLFQVDPEAVNLMKSDTVKAVGITVLIVILTMLFAYPLVIFLDRNLTRRTQQLLEANTSMLETLGVAIAKRDSDTGAHNYRVAYYSMRLGEAAGLSRTQITGLLKGAFLHDIGKIGVRDAILLKPGKLTAEEFTEMQTHVSHGLDIVNEVRWFNDAAEVIGGHHEKWDGSGYPQALQGDDIPLSARIFAIADVFDALTSRRPYKEPFPADKAKSILSEGRGSHFDPYLLDLFLVKAEGLFNEIANKDEAELKETLMSCTCHYLDATV